MSFRAFRVYESGLDKGRITQLEDGDLSPGTLLIDVAYSSVNFKDALAVSGQGKILRQFPLNAGIDAAGRVRKSDDPRFKAGDAVLVTGCGLGESVDGGFAERIRVPAEWAVALPEGLDARQAMILGTAGFTAGICLQRFLKNDQTPDMGPILVTGASGGVGSLATAMLHKLGFDVIAVSGKREMAAELRAIGAKEVLHPDDLKLGSRPLESVRFGGAIDNVGGTLLSQILPHVNLWGNIASVGLAGSADLQTTVMPFILRGVSVLGISSTNCPPLLRRKIWKNLASDWMPADLETFVSREITLEEVPEAAQRILGRKSEKRTLVRL